jgi:hypothetical protein
MSYKASRKEFVEFCKEAQHPIVRIGDVPLETRKAVIEIAKKTAKREGKSLRDLLPFVALFRDENKVRKVAIVIEKEFEIT